MVVAMACTENWYHYLTVDIYSLLKTTPSVRKIYLLLETDNIDDIPELKKVVEKYPVELKIINFNNMIDDLVEKGNVNRDRRYSNFCFARLALPSIVKEDKVLYMDTDTIIVSDISELWDIDINNYYLAGCQDYGAFYSEKLFLKLGITGKYVNSGILLMNLKKIREDKDNIQEKWFQIVNENDLENPDQDALNAICQNKELYISNKYNFCLWTGADILENDSSIEVKSMLINKNISLWKNPNIISQEDVKIIHYAGPKKDWIKDMIHSKFWYDKEKKFYDEFSDRR